MLLGSNLGGLPRGALSADAFVLGTAAQDAEDVILYDRGTGRLWVDVDGTGDAAPVLFAVLEGRPDLGADDFILV
jgi:Ca2+-binding RTX toxin-like protein